MDKVTLSFLFLLLIIFVGSVFYAREAFVDASGNKDSSGNTITLSLADLFSLIGGTTSSTTNTTTVLQPSTSSSGTPESSLDSQFLTDLKGTILSDVRQTVRDTLQSSGGGAGAGGAPVLTDSCIDSVADQQGADFMRYIPGKNPADYIRKDSIPCYSCSIPT